MRERERDTYPAKGPQVVLLAESTSREGSREGPLGRGSEVVHCELLERVWLASVCSF